MAVDRQFGAVGTSIAIDLPEGRKNLTPAISIRYSSNAPNSAFGHGWDLQLGCVKRDTTKGVPFDYSQASPVYSNSQGFTLAMSGGSIELDTPLPSNAECGTPWAASSEETWLLACFDEPNNLWRVRDKQGITYTYGFVQGSSASETRTGFDVSAAGGTFAWMLTRVEDLNGNEILYEYFKDDGHSYPLRVRYGGHSQVALDHIFHVEFVTEPRPAADAVISYRGGFRDRLALRIVAVEVWVDGYGPAEPIRTYHLSYTQDPDTQRSLLSQVSLTLTGTTLPPPPTTFVYSTSGRGFDAVAKPFAGMEQSPVVSRTEGGILGQTFTDVTGDGMPDFVGAFSTGGGPYGSLQALQGSFKSYAGDWPEFTELRPGGNDWGAPEAVDPVFYLAAVSSPYSRLVDMDGDSLPDFVRAPTLDLPGENDHCCNSTGLCPNLPCIWEVFRNLGDSLDPNPILWPGVPDAALYWVGGPKFPAVDIIDLTGDGRPDLIDCQNPSGSNGWYTCNLHYNTGSGFASPIPWQVPSHLGPHPLRWSTSLGDVRAKDTFDINGDGLPDIVSSQPEPGISSWEVWFNNGHGFEPGAEWPGVVGEIEITPLPGYVSKGLRDMNGDGLQDYVTSLVLGDDWLVYLNTGASFAAAVPWVNTSGRLQERDYPTNGGFNVIADVLDVNGDSIADRVLPGSAHMGLGAPGNLMLRLENGFGASFEASYRESKSRSYHGPSSTWESFDALGCMPDCPHEVPFPVWVARELVTDPDVTVLNDQLETKFHFVAPYFDTTERQFRGFRQQLEYNINSWKRTTRVFAPPPYHASIALDWPSPSWAGGAVPSRNFRLVYAKTADPVAPGPSMTTITDWEAVAAGDGRYRVHGFRSVSTDRPSSSAPDQQVSTRLTEFDAYNNMVAETVSGTTTANGSTTNDFAPIKTTAAYDAGPLCPGLPTQVTIWADEGANMALSRRQVAYDEDNCNLLNVESFLAPAGQSATAGTAVQTLAVFYDATVDPIAVATGQPTRLEDAREFSTTLTYNVSGTYDCGHGLFPCVVSNALGHSTTTWFDLRWGKPTLTNDVNGAASTFSYDDLGRPKSITRPLSSGTCDGSPCRSTKFEYAFGLPGTPARITTKLREPNDASGYRTINAFFDALGRPLGKKELRYVNQIAQVIAFDAVSYDIFGRVTERHSAFPGGGDLNTFEPPTNVPGTSLVYDTLDRVVQTINPDGTYKTVDFSAVGRTTLKDENYNDCSTNQTSCPGAKTVEYRDAIGRGIRTDTFEGAATLITTTTSIHDALGRVTSTTVTPGPTAGGASAVTTFEFDSLSRRTAMVDPDSGRWTYEYDNAGNLKFQNDPKTGQSIAFCYDVLSRVVRKSYLSVDSSSSVTWGNLCNTSIVPAGRYSDYTYDSGSNGIGRLSSVADAGGWFDLVTSFTYDARGRAVREEWDRQIWGRSIVAGIDFTWDAADRRSTVRYPGTGTTIQDVFSTYGSTGQLQGSYASGQTFAGNAVYDTFGRLTEWRDGSGLNHRADFYGADNNFRLQRLKVYDPVNTDPNDPQNPTYLQLYYNAYDAVGNLRVINDLGSTYPNPSVLNNTWSYTYDGIGRLESSQWYTQQAKPFDYDGVGNMTSGNGMTFEHFDESHPHRMTDMWDGGASSGLVPTYDSNGALTTVPGSGETNIRTVEYDADGRVDRVTAFPGPHTVRSVYDFRGQRVARIVDEGLASQSITFYYGQWFEVTDATLTRHMYLGDRLIAESPVAAPASLTLATLTDAERGTLLARTMSEELRQNPTLYPKVYLGTETAAAAGAAGILFLVVLVVLPWETRLGYFGRVRRGRVGVVVLLFSLSLMPFGQLHRAQACCGDPGPPSAPVYPVYFLHTDHLGSTLALGCHKQTNGCADRTVYRYYRYGAYGQMKAYDSNGALLPSTQAPTVERLYTGQVWDTRAQMYYYNARFYEPKMARFLTTDPVREYMSPYAYVRWNPLAHVDPSGNLTVPTPGVGLGMAMEQMNNDPKYRGWIGLLQFRAPGLGGFNGPNGAGPGGGAGHGGFMGGNSLQAMRVAVELANTRAEIVTIGVRTYAPFETFGGGWGGDSKTMRDPNATQSLTARSWTNVEVDVTTGAPRSVDARSDPTSFFGVEVGTADPAVSGQSLREGGFSVTTSAGNPATYGYGPNIDTTVTANVQGTGPSPDVSVSLAGDGFPSTQIYAKLPSGSTIVLFDFNTAWSSYAGSVVAPYVALWGPGDTPLGSSSGLGR